MRIIIHFHSDGHSDSDSDRKSNKTNNDRTINVDNTSNRKCDCMAGRAQWCDGRL